MNQTNLNPPGGYLETPETAILPELSPNNSAQHGLALIMSGNPKRSLPALTEAIEFLERIQRANPFLQQIAIRFKGKVLGIDQRHLYRIASIYLDLAGGAR